MKKKPLLQATDLDLDENAEIGYEIVGGNVGNVFRIDTATGEVMLQTPIDYEQMDPASNGKYVLSVQARDAGNPQLHTTVPVYINIQVGSKVVWTFKLP